MSSNKEEKSQAADKIKAATLTAAKGLSRAQAERAAAAAARNVNAYGQKEEGPSRWQEKKEAKRQMYLMSTEKAVRLGERKDLKPTMGGVTTSSQCQKCFQVGHWTYECKNERVYISRPSRSQQLKNPKLRQKLVTSHELDNSDVLDEGNKSNKGKKNEKSDSGSSSSSSEDESGSVSSYSSSTDSEEERRRRKKRKNKKTGRRRSKKYSSSSSESDSESESEDESSSDSDSDDRRSRKKTRKHSSKR